MIASIVSSESVLKMNPHSTVPFSELVINGEHHIQTIPVLLLQKNVQKYI